MEKKMSKCTNCGKEIPDSAKFCRYCGTKFAANDDFEANKHYITWNILPGQIAQKVTENEIASYGEIRGLIVQTGVKGLFFVNGKVCATLEAGKYSFKKLEKPSAVQSKKGRVATFIENLFSFLKGKKEELKESKLITVVLVRDVEFPLVFELTDVATADIRSNVALHLVLKITNLNTFYENQLLDKNFVSFSSFAEALTTVVKNTVNMVVSGVNPQDINGNIDLTRKFSDILNSQFSSIYPYIELVHVLSFSCSQKDLENIRGLKEELYIAEQELEQTQLRNAFLNRLQNVDYSQQLAEARSKTDFEALMDKIDEDHELNQAKKDQFIQMLETERTIRGAKSRSEIELALADLEKNGLLKKEEVDSLREDIKHRQELKNAQNDFEISLSTLRNEKTLDKERLDWEIEIGNKRVENELARQKLKDDYSDSRRRAELELDREELASQLELLRQAQALRNEREDSEHRRNMEIEQLHVDASLNRQKIYSTMSFEQIMAANPDISPEAAQALAKKFEAEALASQNDKTAQMAMQQKEDMQQFMEKQMDLMREMIAGKAKEDSSKQAEYERHQDRYIDGVKTAISSVASAFKPSQQANRTTSRICPKCGTKNPADSIFCSECGESF